MPVRPADPAVGTLRVTAVLRTGDLNALRATLKEAFGLRIEALDSEFRVRRTDAIQSE